MADETRYKGARLLRDRREQLELTQQELADLANVSLSSVSRLERGTRLEPRKERQIAKALGIAANGVEAAYRGEPLPELDEVAALDTAQVSIKQLSIEVMTDDEMERLATFVAEVRGDPAEKHQLMADMLRIRAAARRADLTVRDREPQG